MSHFLSQLFGSGINYINILTVFLNFCSEILDYLEIFPYTAVLLTALFKGNHESEKPQIFKDLLFSCAGFLPIHSRHRAFSGIRRCITDGSVSVDADGRPRHLGQQAPAEVA